MLAVPLGWATLLPFHPNPTNDIHAGLSHQTTRWLIVHVGSMVCIGLMAGVLWLLVCDLAGRAAWISRAAIVPYVLFYGAGEAILGVATGVLVRHADAVPAAQRSAAAAAVRALWDDVLSDDLIIGVGGVARVIAVTQAAVAHRQSGAPLGVAVLLGARQLRSSTPRRSRRSAWAV